MAKKPVILSETQKSKNETILRRLREEREQLWAETRAMQESWNENKRRAKRRKA